MSSIQSPTTDLSLEGNDALREFMDKLTCSTNLSRHGIELPMICVMGDTSAGKSSLLSSLAMVELPSSHELTTRCPVLCKMNRADLLQATVGVVWKSPSQPPRQDFETVCLEGDLSGLGEAILAAQEYILQQTPNREVAPDVIEVSLQGPQYLQDLTLMDLPGIARTRAESESATLVQDSLHLLESYLANPRCIILAVLPANVDFHNSQILSLAQKVDPTTERTIPVITKPDLIDIGAEQQVEDLLLGNKIDFGLGFHMCKGRGQASLQQGQSLESCIQQEEEFFNTRAPWKDVAERGLFGTTSLRKKLGDLQIKMIRATIPDILSEIHQKQQTAFQKLVAMGNVHQSSSDKRRYYQDYCQSYMTSLKASLSGKGKRAKQASAAAKLHDACAAFMEKIGEGSLGTIMSVVEGAQVVVASSQGDIRGEVVHVDEAGHACVDFVDKKDHTVGVLFDYIGYLAQETTEQLEEDDVWSDGSKVYIARKSNKCDLLTQIPLNRIRTDPSWLKEKIAENRTDDLACFLNVDMFKSIINDFIEEDWTPHCKRLINETSDIVLSTVIDALKNAGEYQRFPRLHSLIREQSTRAARALLLEAEKQLKRHLEVEMHPYTQDTVLLENIASARHRNIRRELDVALCVDQESKVYDVIAIKTIMDGVFERNRLKSVEEHMAEDMEIVLEAYGKVATKRVIDRTPMICWEVFRSLVQSIQDTLFNMTDAQLAEAMKDSDGFNQRHEALSEELEQMNKALAIFQSLL